MSSSLLSIAEVAADLGVSTKSVRRWITAGHLEAVRVGPRLIRIERTALERFKSDTPAAA